MNAPDFFWQPYHPLGFLLWPLSVVFRLSAAGRRLGFRLGLFRAVDLPVPVVVIGNITVGGTGKTPLVIWAARHLRRLGYKPGIVSRGYGGKAKRWPQQVSPGSDAREVGDEAVLMARRTQCPVAVGPDRVAAAQALLRAGDCDVVLSDDGLQHYALKRDLEIVVLDGARRLGNGLLLPAGPLREGRWRLERVDLVVVNGPGSEGELSMQPGAGEAVNLVTGESEPLRDLDRAPLYAVAGIGNPGRFFTMLEHAGLSFAPHPFPDHHDFKEADLDFAGDGMVLMTEKDAVKCERFARPNWWYVPLEVLPEAAFIHRFSVRVEELVRGQEAARRPGVSDLQG